jgi:DNA repair ATPase RecN
MEPGQRGCVRTVWQVKILDALDMYEDADAAEDGYKHRQRVKTYRKARSERRALREARKEMQNG